MLEGLKPPVRANYLCKVRFYLTSLKKTDAEILEKAIDDTKLWPAKTLSDQLAQRNVKIADTTIAKHRNQRCSCYREDADID
jgi:hypothetical protein